MEQPDRMSELERAVADLQRRMSRAEGKLNLDPLPEAEPASPPLETTTPPEVAPPPLPAPEVPAVPRQPTFQLPTGALEEWFSGKGLVRFGFILSIIGLVGVSIYQLTQHGPLVKDIAGFAFALAALVGGEYFYRRRDSNLQAQTTLGLGYVAAYFFAYAMQNVSSLQIMDAPVLNAGLLLVLAAGCLTHSIVRRLESLAMLSLVGGFVAISMSHLDYKSVFATALLAVVFSAVVVKMNWRAVLVGAMVGSYSTFVWLTSAQIDTSTTTNAQALLLSGAFLTIFWLVFNATIVMLEDQGDKPAEKALLPGLALGNGAAFVVLTLSSMTGELADYRWLFLLTTGVAYFVGAAYTASRSKEWLTILFTLVGLSLVTAAVPLKLAAQATSTIWLIEVPVLVFAGLHFKLPSLRAFAAFLAVISLINWFGLAIFDTSSVTVIGWDIHYRLIVGLVAAFSMLASVIGYFVYDGRQLEIEERAIIGYGLAFLALIWLLPLMEASTSTLSVIWLVEGVILLGFATRTDAEAALPGSIFTASAFAAALSIAGGHNVWWIAEVVALWSIGVATYLSAEWLPAAPRRAFGCLHIAMAVVLLWVTTLAQWPAGLWLPAESVVVWESLAVLLMGFWLGDRLVRQGAAVGMIAVAWFALHATWTWGLVLPVVAAWYAAAGAYKYFALVNRDEPNLAFIDRLGMSAEFEGKRFYQGYVVAGSALLAFGCVSLLSHWQLVAALSVEAMALMAMSLVLRDHLLRRIGSIVFLVLIAMQGLNVIYGAESPWYYSALTAGAAMLVTGFANTGLSNRLKSGTADSHTGGGDDKGSPPPSA